MTVTTLRSEPAGPMRFELQANATLRGVLRQGTLTFFIGRESTMIELAPRSVAIEAVCEPVARTIDCFCTRDP